jgi:hypothetical protein
VSQNEKYFEGFLKGSTWKFTWNGLQIPCIGIYSEHIGTTWFWGVGCTSRAHWWRGVDDVNDRPVGNPKRRCDEHNSKFSLSYETKVYQSSRKKPNAWRWCMLASWQLWIIYKVPRPVLCFAPVTTRNLPTTQPRTLLPTYDEVVNLTGLL